MAITFKSGIVSRTMFKPRDGSAFLTQLDTYKGVVKTVAKYVVGTGVLSSVAYWLGGRIWILEIIALAALTLVLMTSLLSPELRWLTTQKAVSFLHVSWRIDRLDRNGSVLLLATIKNGGPWQIEVSNLQLDITVLDRGCAAFTPTPLQLLAAESSAAFSFEAKGGEWANMEAWIKATHADLSVTLSSDGDVICIDRIKHVSISPLLPTPSN